MSPKRKQYDDDDGKVIINMNVEGMPWHDRSARRKQIVHKESYHAGQMTRAQSRMYTWYAVLYGLGIAAVFSVTWILFTIFCTQIWFK